MRFRWSVLEIAEQLVKEDDRVSKHNAFLNAMSMLRTVLDKKEKSVDWFEMLGEDIQKKNRKRAGDFACYMVMFRELSER